VPDKLETNGKAAPSRSDKTLAAPERDEIKIVAPRVWDATVGDPWWRESSFDLHRGLDVSEDSVDSIPAELLDELFKR